jgi:hypothetical protein
VSICPALNCHAAGADIWDPATKTYVGRFNNMGQNEPFLPINQALFSASNVGGYYPGNNHHVRLLIVVLAIRITLWYSPKM